MEELGGKEGLDGLCRRCCLGEFKHFPEPPKGKAKRFRLAPQKSGTTAITFNVVEGLTTKSNFKVGNATVTQIHINSNIEQLDTSCRV